MTEQKKSCCTPITTTECCSESSCCCGSPHNPGKEIVIDFLYIDLSVCERCQGTGKTLTEAIEDVRRILEAAAFTIKVNYIHVQSEEQAEELGFTSSPTIRINGQDIQIEVRETLCESCGDLCGGDVDCRVWIYDGKEYTVPPKPLIVNAILGYIYGGGSEGREGGNKKPVPENLKRFFALRKKNK
ncbi:MAG: DUF2703 domain-containing protein [Negativicutes bacterium]|nr:DUF2703 domain-containing protein [Negativicutes bacterium]